MIRLKPGSRAAEQHEPTEPRLLLRLEHGSRPPNSLRRMNERDLGGSVRHDPSSRAAEQHEPIETRLMIRLKPGSRAAEQHDPTEPRLTIRLKPDARRQAT
jgi:hypothetical protein